MQLPKVIIVDDHDIFRDGLISLLTLKKIATVVGSASNGEDFLALLEKESPDLVLMDIAMPKMDGMEATKKALQVMPDLNILVLSMYGDEKYYYQMINAGAKGFILKSSGKDELIDAIGSVAKGQSYFSNELLRKLIIRLGQKNDTNEEKTLTDTNLTKREKEVLQLLCNGLTAAEIADSLGLSKKTIEGHRTHLFSKTGTKNSVALVLFAIKNELVNI